MTMIYSGERTLSRYMFSVEGRTSPVGVVDITGEGMTAMLALVESTYPDTTITFIEDRPVTWDVYYDDREPEMGS